MKSKKCKGIGRAAGRGCGKRTMFRKYGLCNACYKDFLFNTASGQGILSKSLKKAKSKQRKAAKEKLMSWGDYAKKLQIEINTIVRLIDNEKGCHSCEHGWGGEWTRQKHAGHFYAVGGAGAHLRFNLLNIHVQCSICNNWKSANQIEYRKKLIQLYGTGYVEMLDKLKSSRAEKKTIAELKNAILVARKIKSNLKKGRFYSRAEINEKLWKNT